MRPKYTLLLFLPFLSLFSTAQDFTVNEEIKKIDSLIQYHQLDRAKEKTDSLYKELNKFNREKKYKPQLLELKYRHAFIIDKQDETPAEVIRILLEMKDEVESERLHSLSCRIYLLIALAYEKAETDPDDLQLTKKYLDKAYTVYKTYKLEEVYSTYCIRKSSYYRWKSQNDSALYYAERARDYAQKYQNETDLADSYILLTYYSYRNKNYKEALGYNLLRLKYSQKINDTTAIAINYADVAGNYLKMQRFTEALLYSDSAYHHYSRLPLRYKNYLPENRHLIFEESGHIDSAFHYFKLYHNDWQLLRNEEESLKTKQVEEQYQNDKKEAVIKSKNQQMIFIVSLLGVIAVGSVLLIGKNRKINKQNKIINKQLGELTKTLEQKQMLLSELQHRIKNNLQHVISILEIQKESADFNNIDEVIRGNQNRIHSMALLHKKLDVSDNVDDVDLKRYVAELAELVKESYDSFKRKVNIHVKCTIARISIEKALPLGLIITELVSNSIKHAFKKRNIGIINIEITKNGTAKLYYSDNGSGFDFNQPSEKGLGQEIIKGLIDQLNGKTETSSSNGFELTIAF